MGATIWRREKNYNGEKVQFWYRAKRRAKVSGNKHSDGRTVRADARKTKRGPGFGRHHFVRDDNGAEVLAGVQLCRLAEGGKSKTNLAAVAIGFFRGAVAGDDAQIARRPIAVATGKARGICGVRRDSVL